MVKKESGDARSMKLKKDVDDEKKMANKEVAKLVWTLFMNIKMWMQQSLSGRRSIIT